MASTATQQLYQDFTFHNLELLETASLPTGTLATQPVHPAGAVFYNLDEDLLYASTGTAWLPLLAGTTVVGTNVSITAPLISLVADGPGISLNASAGALGMLADTTVTILADNGEARITSKNSNVIVEATGSAGDIQLTSNAGAVTATADQNVTLVSQTNDVELSSLAGNVSLAAFENININGIEILALQTSSSGSGAIPIKTLLHEISITAGADALTLTAGTVGQLITVIAVASAGGTATLTPAPFLSGSSITFGAVGDTATLVTGSNGFYMTGGTATLNP